MRALLRDRTTGNIVYECDLLVVPADGQTLVRARAVRQALRTHDEDVIANTDGVPRVDNLEAKILAAIDAGGRLRMSAWHGVYDYGAQAGLDRTCNTTHCLAGWAIHLAGAAGYELERELVDPEDAGRLIWIASTGEVPDFYGDDVEALEWLQERVRRLSCD